METNASIISGLQSQQQPGGERSLRNGQEEVAARAPETRDGGEDAQARQGEDQVGLNQVTQDDACVVSMIIRLLALLCKSGDFCKGLALKRSRSSNITKYSPKQV